MTQNPNWPVIDESISWPSNPTSPTSAAPWPLFWSNIKARTEGSGSHKHGKQYELDQYQTGIASTVVANNDGAFNPANTGSPFYPQVQAYRAYRKRAQWPPTINMLSAAQATPGTANDEDLTAVAAGSMPYVTDNGGGPYSTAVTITSGVGSYHTSLPSGATVGSNVLRFAGVPVTPSVAYSAQIRLRTSTSSVSMLLRFVWWAANGGVISRASGSAATAVSTGTVVVSVANAVAPSNAVGMTLELYTNGAPGAALTLTADEPQVELSTAISAWVASNRWYPLAGMFATSYPQDWADAGTYGTATIGAVDIFGWESQRKLFNPVYHEILNLGPSFFYALDEPQSAAAFQDATGQQAPIAFANRGPGVSGYTAAIGVPIAALTTPPKGLGGPVAEIEQPATGTGGGIVLPLQDTANTWPPTSTGWTRMFAVNPAVLAAGSSVVMWQLVQNLPLTQSAVLGQTYIEVTAAPGTGGCVVMAVARNGTLLVNSFDSATADVTDGGFHLITVTMSADGKTITLYVDDLESFSYTDASDMRFLPMNGADLLGTAAPSNSIQYTCLAQYPSALSLSQIQQISRTLANGGNADSEGNYTSATRYADILRWAGYEGPTAIDAYSTGTTVAYGAPTDLWASRDQGGTDVVSALQTVVDTENGTHFVSNAGVITFKSRRSRYNRDTPVVVFGENTAAGEIPYIDSPFNYDPSRVANDAQLTQANTNRVFEVVNAASVEEFGDITLQRQLNSIDENEMLAAGQFLSARFGTPLQRIESITIPTSSFTVAGVPNGAAWLALLPLDAGARVRVMRRPPGAPTIQLEGFVESVAWKFDDKGNAVPTLQISNAAGLDYWQLGSSHTTLHTLTAVGATTATLNALPDSATNAIQSNISLAGTDLYAWVIDWGLATCEYVTLTPTANAAGYTTWVTAVGATKRFDTGATGTGFQFAHAANAVIQDIGGYLAEVEANNASLGSFLSPPGALDAYSTVGSSTIVSY